MRRFPVMLSITGGAIAMTPAVTAAQVVFDRADPTIGGRTLPVPPAQTPDAPAPTLPSEASAAVAPVTGTIIPRAITVSGAPDIGPAAFADVIVSYVGRPLSRDALSELAGAISAVARKQGFPFATAIIPHQPMTNGVLQVTLDQGQIDAVRVIGAINPAADRILTTALATGKPTRQADLERAILLVGDLPGITVNQSRFMRQDGFGILLVTIKEKRLSAYAQLDNRGSKEIGPIRSTLLASVAGIAQSGDELGLIVAQTPLQPSEFIFLGGRYAMPVDSAGSRASISASYGRSHPGASLKPLDVVGKSVDAAVGYSRVLQRSRTHDASLNMELRTMHIQQRLAGLPLRNDKLTTLTAGVDAADKFAGGILRSEAALTAGLPLPGVSHEGDVMISRGDGDARFVTANYTVSWTRPLSKTVSFMLSSAGQLASRPLLATAEIGAGGQSFGRAYDYADRTGDQGVLGLFELRYDASAIIPGIVDRFQLYSSIDGGYVSNLRDGAGGGSLLSSSLGARLGKGRIDGMVEISLPMNADRFDTRNRDPRLSIRLARVF
ncbi:ShlB/FhaC/HecB family hemolysin secretion/activation protein [Sphingobium sufflavum]|nr:ShlB/FhaC/HecB family hemolysin secretion/activation protein [Sphingobium sufflavum]